ncbi:MAG: serine hydrolase [Anaerolineae bacterium]|jgi:CubicO group peptidase (beta-lactamase class C family)
MDSDVLVRIFDYIDQHDLDVHGLLVVRHGHTILEAYYPPYGPDIRHRTASVGKSFTGALVGIAIREGHIAGVDQRVADCFSDHADWKSDRLKQAMTIEHLLTMTSGLDWPESSVPYSSPHNVMGHMMRTSDWVGFVLDRAPPSTTAPAPPTSCPPLSRRPPGPVPSTSPMNICLGPSVSAR